MKKLILGLIILLAIFTGCEDSSVTPKKESRFVVHPANASAIVKISAWVKTSASGRIKDEYDNYESLQQIDDTGGSGYSIYTILHSNDPTQALSFTLDRGGEVAMVFTSHTFQDPSGNITSEIYNEYGVHTLSYIDYTNGTRTVIYDNPQGDRWWADADACVGKFHNLTGSNIGDIAVGTLFNVATLGLYTPLSLVLCAGYATFK
jgi:hypothetical protein